MSLRPIRQGGEVMTDKQVIKAICQILIDDQDWSADTLELIFNTLHEADVLVNDGPIHFKISEAWEMKE
jgi:hypothetical protein